MTRLPAEDYEQHKLYLQGKTCSLVKMSIQNQSVNQGLITHSWLQIPGSSYILYLPCMRARSEYLHITAAVTARLVVLMKRMTEFWRETKPLAEHQALLWREELFRERENGNLKKYCRLRVLSNSGIEILKMHTAVQYYRSRRGWFTNKG